MDYRLCIGALTGFLLAACGAPTQDTTEVVPSETSAAKTWPHGAMVAAADPRAVQAGLDVLAAGGHAVDAAIAVHAVLGLVEPQSSGLGGGAFMMVYDNASGDTLFYDGRETAPADVTDGLFLKDGEEMGYIQAWQSGRSVGVPGQIALYKAAHDAHGQAPWADVFQPAIDLAADGFVVSPRLAGLLANPRLRGATRLDDEGTAAAAYFYPEGEPLAEGTLRDNPDYAQLLRDVVADGPAAFYAGPRAERIAAAVTGDPEPGTMTIEDLANYRVEVRSPLCGRFRIYTVCSGPPPGSGGVTQNMILGIYERIVDGASEALSEEDKLIAWVDAQRLAYADRDHYVADPSFVPVPAEDLINPVYLDARARQLARPAQTPEPGDPGEVLERGPIIDLWGRDTTDETPGTTHLSVIDSNGNAVSMTATVESPFGNSTFVDGILLNNELTDFARNPVLSNRPVANAPAGGKRPRSSMSPTFVFDARGDLVMVTGSPGGNSIVAYVSKTLVGVLDWGLSVQDAIDLPNVIARGAEVNVEIGRPGGPEWAAALSAQGYQVRERETENSGLHAIMVRDYGLEGGADPRREGVARTLETDPAESTDAASTP